jgi:class 3 adenylate cyclase
MRLQFDVVTRTVKELADIRQSRLPSVMRLYWTLMAIHVVGAIPMIVVGRIYHVTGSTIVAYVLVLLAVSAVAAIPAAQALFQPMRRLQRALDHGVAPQDLGHADVEAALRTPGRMAVIGMITNGLAILLVPFVAYVMPILEDSVGDMIIAGVAGSTLVAINQMYAGLRMVRQRIAPVLLPDGILHTRGFRMRTIHHVWLLLISVACVPTYLVAAFHTGWERLGVFDILLLCAWSIGLLVHQIHGLARCINVVLRDLKLGMEQVSSGDLSARVAIRHLDAFGFMASNFNRMTEGLQQRDELREHFGRYVTQQVVDEVLAGKVKLGGETKVATVLFADIRDFTRMAETMNAHDVVLFLNEYFSEMVDVILDSGGMLDKFVGDGIFAVFGVPTSTAGVQQDAAAAARCGLTMLRRLDKLNQTRAAAGLPLVRIGIGLHTGEVVAGNVGSPKRMQYTVIGDTVNVGARLEAMTKGTPHALLCSHETAVHLRSSGHRLVPVGEMNVRGRNAALDVFAVYDDTSTPLPIPDAPPSLSQGAA